MQDKLRRSEDLRLTIRDAMQRLLDGKPIRSDGKLTVKSLAVEAGVKRWVLTHQHRDLQQEFRDRCANRDDTPVFLAEVTERNRALMAELADLQVKVTALTEEAHRYMRIIQVLTLENLDLREQIGNRSGKVSHLR